jgi:glycosyltransferase involved in cell wall biosynthesis
MSRTGSDIDHPQKTLAFVRMGPFPICNRLLPKYLAAALPGWTIDIFDVKPALRRMPLTLLLNLFFLARENGVNVLAGRLTLWQAFFTTTYIFKRMSSIARRWIQQGDYAASIQIQSLFDAHTPERPNLVYTDHTHLENLRYPDFDPRTLRRSAWVELERELYRNAVRLLTRSRNISSSMIEDYGCEPERIELVGSGSNIDFDPEQRRSCAASNSDPLRILFVGKDWERKGGPDLLEAFARLRRSHPGARLQVAGPDRIPAAPGVEHLGHRSLDELRTLYLGADIFCLPTHLEPFGVATLEAMHASLPVVATRVGALPDLVEEGESGLLVEVGDRDGLHRALARLADDPVLRLKMGERGRTRATSEFSWERVADRISPIICSEAR